MLPLCAAEGVGVIPWSPLARGRLTRPWSTATDRSETDVFGKTLYAATENADQRVVERLADIAASRDLPMAEIALAWVLHKSEVSAPIIGATKPGQLESAIAALSIELSDEEVLRLEEPYVPHSVVGFS